MADGGETPGIGVRAAPKLSTRAPKAWHSLADAALVRLPVTLSRSQQLRRRLRRVK